jgi:hypothetical protein
MTSPTITWWAGRRIVVCWPSGSPARCSPVPSRGPRSLTWCADCWPMCRARTPGSWPYGTRSHELSGAHPSAEQPRGEGRRCERRTATGRVSGFACSALMAQALDRRCTQTRSVGPFRHGPTSSSWPAAAARPRRTGQAAARHRPGDTTSTGPSSIRRGTDIVPYPFAVAVPGGAGAGGFRSRSVRSRCDPCHRSRPPGTGPAEPIMTGGSDGPVNPRATP